MTPIQEEVGNYIKSELPVIKTAVDSNLRLNVPACFELSSLCDYLFLHCDKFVIAVDPIGNVWKIDNIVGPHIQEIELNNPNWEMYMKD